MFDMPDEVIWELLDQDREDEPEDGGYFRRTSRQCKFCGRSNLHWKMVQSEWRLHNKLGLIHRCAGHSPVIPQKPKY